MRVTLLHNTPLWVADKAIGKCWNKPTPDVELDGVDMHGFPLTEPGCNVERIDRVANKNKHASTIEHLSYNIDIDGISRGCLHEHVRHRISSFSVKSSRYTLKELKCETPFTRTNFHLLGVSFDRAKKYLVMTGDYNTDYGSIIQLEILRRNIASGTSNDIAKYNIPECYKTSLVWTVNARSLQNFLTLRNDKSAHWEIRDLAKNIYDALPYDHKFLFEGHLNENKD